MGFVRSRFCYLDRLQDSAFEMTDDLETKAPRWVRATGTTSWRAPPSILAHRAHSQRPNGERSFSEIERNDEYDWDNETVDEYRWTFGISEDDAGFGEAEFEYREAPDVEEAKQDCWGAVIAFLRGEGYADDEIAASVP